MKHKQIEKKDIFVFDARPKKLNYLLRSWSSTIDICTYNKCTVYVLCFIDQLSRCCLMFAKAGGWSPQMWQHWPQHIQTNMIAAADCHQGKTKNNFINVSHNSSCCWRRDFWYTLTWLSLEVKGCLYPLSLISSI